MDGHERNGRPGVSAGGEVPQRAFFPRGRLVELAALASAVQARGLKEATAPIAVVSAIRELNDVSQLAEAVGLGLPGAGEVFQGTLARAIPRRYGDRGQRALALSGALEGLRGIAVGPCGEPITRAGEVLQEAFALDVRNGNLEPTYTQQAAAYIQGRVRTVAQFEGKLWREAGQRAAGLDGGLGLGAAAPSRPKPGPHARRPVEPGPYDEQILPPDYPLPHPPPDFGGPERPDPGLCAHLGELCIALFEQAAATLLGDPFLDLLATVEPDCVCHNYDPNHVFVGRPAHGRQFPVPLPADVRLIFGRDPTDITANIVDLTREQLRFTIPPHSRTGRVYLRGPFLPESPVTAVTERLCGISMPHLPSMPGHGPAALIGIIAPPVFDALTADGETGRTVVVQQCRAVKVCWHAHLEDQPPHVPPPPCARIEVVVRNETGDVLHEGEHEGCINLAGAEDETVTLEARSFAGEQECGRTDPIPITLERVAQITLERDKPAEEALVAGTDGRFFAEISCPASAAGVEVRLRSNTPALQVPAAVVIPEGQTLAPVDFTSMVGTRGRVDIRATAEGHQEGWLAFQLVASPAERCRAYDDVSGPWSRHDESWANWGVIDSPDTFLGFLPTTRLFRPTNQYETAQAVRRAEADARTIRALGSGWSFSEAVLPQSSDLTGADQLVAGPVRVGAFAGAISDASLRTLAGRFRGHFGYALDTSRLSRSLQVLLRDILDEKVDTSSLFFVEAGMTINFLNTLLDSQTPRVALRTMGGSSGQTIAGAISTGTHGSDFDRPPLADAVRAIYLVGAGGAHHWVEPANRITDPAKLRATYPCLDGNIHYDDDMFRAALVSIGAMGVIYAVILDVVPQYSLLQWNRWGTWEQLKADQAANEFAGLFDGSWTGIAAYLRQRYGAGEPRPRFAQVVINPIRNDNGTHNCYVTNRAELPLQAPSGVTPLTDYTELDTSEVEAAITNDPNFGAHQGVQFHFHADFEGGLMDQLQQLLVFCKNRNYPWAVRAVTDLIMRKTFPLTVNSQAPQIDVSYRVMAPGGETRAFPPLGGTSVESAFSFYDTVPAADQPGLQIVVPDVITFVDAILEAFDQGVASPQHVFPAGWVSLRVTGRTRALLGMQRFERSGMVEVSLIGRPDGYRTVRLVEQITRNLGGALHWGQSMGMVRFIDLEAIYGNALIDRWKTAQRALGGAPFTNVLMRRCGLA